MLLLLTTLVICGTVYFTTRLLASRDFTIRVAVDLPRSLSVNLPGSLDINLPERLGVDVQTDVQISLPVPPALAQAAKPFPTPPRDILLFCAMESEPFAQEEALKKAHQYFERLGNWDSVLLELKHDAGELDESEATE